MPGTSSRALEPSRNVQRYLSSLFPFFFFSGFRPKFVQIVCTVGNPYSRRICKNPKSHISHSLKIHPILHLYKSHCLIVKKRKLSGSKKPSKTPLSLGYFWPNILSFFSFHGFYTQKMEKISKSSPDPWNFGNQKL